MSASPKADAPNGTDRYCDRATKPGDKLFRLFDGGGLYLEVAPSGGKLWRLKYRRLGR
ncbi:Arm DNA-binding domain-containing protein [Tahibacter harae]|uniref:Arm DNA-binding domain-containing protein n=1 Tax=Tahibacter harae TaxID=2963937 RepID=UPI0031BB4136